MSYHAYANSGGNYIDNDDDYDYDPDVYGNWMDGSNINMNIVTPNIRVNDINSQAQAQVQAQNVGGSACPPEPCPPKKKYGYKVCKYEIKEEVNPCKPCKPVKPCKPKKKVKKCYYESDDESSEEECFKPEFVKPKKKCKKKCKKKPHHGHHHGHHGGYHGGNYGGCSSGTCGN